MEISQRCSYAHTQVHNLLVSGDSTLTIWIVRWMKQASKCEGTLPYWIGDILDASPQVPDNEEAMRWFKFCGKSEFGRVSTWEDVWWARPNNGLFTQTISPISQNWNHKTGFIVLLVLYIVENHSFGGNSFHDLYYMLRFVCVVEWRQKLLAAGARGMWKPRPMRVLFTLDSQIRTGRAQGTQCSADNG